MTPTPDPQNDSDSSLLTGLDVMMGSEYATAGQRFVNRLIDFIVIYVACRLLVDVLIYLSLHTGIIDIYSWNRWSFYLVSYIVTFVYYISFEGLSGGRTIGKFCTGTKAVRDDDYETPISAKEAFLRSLVRIVPFNGLSAFGGHPWHDLWTHTKVIQLRK